LSEEITRRRIESVDPTIAKIADQEVARELAESGGRERQTPGRIKRPVRGKTAEQVAVQVKLIDEAISRAGDIIFRVLVLQRVGDIQDSANVLDIEWSKAASGWLDR
jgi:hypothetical protein